MEHFPNWAPKDAIEAYESIRREEEADLVRAIASLQSWQLNGGIPADLDIHAFAIECQKNDGISCADIIRKLLIDIDMMAPWKKLQKLGQQSTYRGVEPTSLTIVLCQRGLLGPIGLEKLPRKKRDAYEAEIVETALKLADLLRITTFDRSYLARRQYRLNVIDIFNEYKSALIGSPPRPKFHDDKLSRFMLDTPSMSSLLVDFAKQVPSLAAGVDMPRPNDAAARRAYFIRYLKGSFLEVFGRPLNDVVAALTRIAFECDIDADKIDRLAPSSSFPPGGRKTK